MTSAASDPTPIGSHSRKMDRGASVIEHLSAIDKLFKDPDVTEICVNRPGEVYTEAHSRWTRHDVPSLTFDKLNSLVTATARFVDQQVSDTKPFLSAVLPGEERAQFVIAPATETKTISLTVRRPSKEIRTMESYVASGFFNHVRPVVLGLSDAEKELLHLKESGNYVDFIKRAVELKLNIVVAGETGSGKTTFMKMVTQLIPAEQRIITIEDVPEMFLPNHANHVHLFYPADAKKDDFHTSAACLKSCLRMKPDRIILAELRGGETFDFINVCASGHGGSITSCHAGTPELTFERLALMVLQNEQGRTLPYDVIRKLLRMTVDVVICVTNDHREGGYGRHITEVWYDPMAKRS